MYIEESKLKDFIVDSGLVTKEDLDFAISKTKSGESFAKQLIMSGKIGEDDLKRVQAYILGVPFINLIGLKIPGDVLNIIPEPIARKHNIIAFKKDGTSLEVAMLDTDDLAAIDFIRKKTGFKILARLTSVDSIKTALVQYQKSLKDDFGEIIKKESGALASVDENAKETSESDLKKIATDLPVVRIVDTLLKHAILQGASDIHIEPQENDLLIRYRIDGLLHETMVLPKSAGLSITARIKVLASLKLDEKRLPQDGRFKIDLDGEKVSFRVSVLPTYYGEKTVMRVLREGGGGFTLEALGFHGDALEKIHEAMKQTVGMILTTGPTGSGKSTTLYTLLDLLNTPDVNISTIEDPVEYQMKRINQTQVKPEIGLTFGEGLRTLVRQDPDIIMVGEIRDGETASLAVNASLTGHLVLSTLHTNSAAGSIPRLVDMGVQPFLLVSTIKVIIAQRLVRKFSERKEKYTLKKAGIDELSKVVNMEKVLKCLIQENVVPAGSTWETVPFYRPLKGEEETAYSGRIGIYEVLSNSSKIKDMILEGVPEDKIQEQAINEGMLTMIEDGIFKAVQGLTSIEEVLRVVTE